MIEKEPKESGGNEEELKHVQLINPNGTLYFFDNGQKVQVNGISFHGLFEERHIGSHAGHSRTGFRRQLSGRLTRAPDSDGNTTE